jgi:hypothetical protein
MAIPLGVRTGTADDVYVLGPGQHPCVLKAVIPNQQKAFQSEELEVKLRFEFETLKARPENDPDAEKAGKHGVISAWVRVTDYQVTDKPNSALTKLLNSIFGRGLTLAEAQALDVEKLAGKVKGHVMVAPGDSGKPKFVAFVLPEGRPAPNPADFKLDEGYTVTAPQPPKSAASSAAPPPTGGPKPKDGGFEDEDIFEEQQARGGKAAAEEYEDPFQ